MVAKGGHPLLVAEAVESLRSRLVPMATVLTPNLPEAHVLAGFHRSRPLPASELAARLLALGPAAVLVKGGHGEGPLIRDVLALPGKPAGGIRDRAHRDTPHARHGLHAGLRHRHGLAQGLGIRDAVVRARAYVSEAIRTAPGLGSGHGPLNHAPHGRPVPRRMTAETAEPPAAAYQGSVLPSLPARSWMYCQATRPERAPRAAAQAIASACKASRAKGSRKCSA